MPLCFKCGRSNAPDARFCSACGTALDVGDPAPPLELRRTVTVVFCDVVGSTSLGEQLDPESIRRIMWRFFETMRAVIERYGGRVEKFIGDAILAVFGVPSQHEDDGLRAVRAAAEMRTALTPLNRELESRWGASLQTRTGVNTGEVVATESSEDETLVLVGDIVNVAARLEQVSPPGNILLGASTYALVRDAVDVDPLAPLELKGKTERVPAFRLIDVRKATAGRPRPLASPMVGRDGELAVLEATFERCARKRSSEIVTALGHAGVGKSRLTHEFISALGDRAAVLHGHCLPYGEGITFWPIAEIVEEGARIAEGDSRDDAHEKIRLVVSGDDDSALIAERLAGAIGLSDSAFDADETTWAVRRFLEIFADERPLVVVFDDIHWGEPTFLDLVESLARARRQCGLLVLCTARPELRESRLALAGDGDDVTAVALEPLGGAESRLLVRNLVDGLELPDHVSRHVTLAAEGNPLFLEELLRMLIDDGLLRKHDGEWRADEQLWPLSVPSTVEALLGARLDRLDKKERAILRRAAVIGQEFSRGAVAEFSPEVTGTTLDTHLSALVRKGFLRRADRRVVGGEALRFTHILIRDVAYHRLLKESRSRLHERFASWLAESVGDRVGEFEEILGYHLEQAYAYREALAPLDDRAQNVGQRAARHLAIAGRRALARGDMPAAAGLVERASALPQEEQDRIEALLDLAFAQSEVDPTRAAAVVTEAIAAAASTGDQRLHQHSLLARAWLRTSNDPTLGTDELVDTAQRAIALFEPLGDEMGLARAWHLVGLARLNACCCAAGLEALDTALIHARRVGDRGAEAEILLDIITALYYGPTSCAEAIGRCEKILQEARGQQRIEASALNALAGLSAMRGCFSQARDLYSRGRVIGSNFGSKVSMAAMALFSGEVEMLAGNHGAAERDRRWGRGILVEIGETALLSTLAAQLAEAVYAQGRIQEAERFTDESAATAAPWDVFAQVAWRATRAKAVAQRGQPERAERLAREAVSLAENGDALNLHGDASIALAEVLAAAGRPHEAVMAYEAAQRAYNRKGNIVSAETARGAFSPRFQPV